MNFEELYEKIDNGEITLDELNGIEHLDGVIDEELIEGKIAYYSVYQQALKIAINALYGALANTYFLLFNRDVAASITGNGRIFIQGLSEYINEKLKGIFGEQYDFVVYNDTDSVVGDSVISTKLFGDIKIEDYFNQIQTEKKILGKDNFIKELDINDYTYSISEDGELKMNRIIHVMKHKVKKRMFKINIKDKSVVVTEDHSIIIKRNGVIKDSKPKDIRNGDFLIKLDKDLLYETNFTIEDLGIQEHWVYDLEVENDHNFFANRICVHNSGYFTLEKLVERFETEDNSEILEKLINFDKKFLDVWVQEYIDKFSETFNVYNKDVIGAKLEKVADKGLFVAKKKNSLRVVWDEGSVLVNNPKLSVTGLEIVRSSTPKFCKKYLKNMVSVILDKPEKETVEELSGIEQEFYKANIEDISRVSGIGSLDYEGEIGKYTVWKNEKTLTAPMNVRAAMNYNNFLKTLDLPKYQEITKEDKIKYVFLKSPNILGDDVIAYLDSNFLVDSGLEKYIDKERMWQDFFISSVKIMLEAAGYEINKNFSIEEWL